MESVTVEAFDMRLRTAWRPAIWVRGIESYGAWDVFFRYAFCRRISSELWKICFVNRARHVWASVICVTDFEQILQNIQGGRLHILVRWNFVIRVPPWNHEQWVAMTTTQGWPLAWNMHGCAKEGKLQMGAFCDWAPPTLFFQERAVVSIRLGLHTPRWAGFHEQYKG